MVKKKKKVSSMQKDIKIYNRAVIQIDFLYTADDYCRLLVTFENSLDQDQVCVCECVCVCVCLSMCVCVSVCLSA